MSHMTSLVNGQTFVDLRPRLFAVAYRMLGTVSDAEDVVQDAFLRWQKVDHNSVRDATGFLIRTVTRLCLDHMRAARIRRETYPGEWLPEPLITDDATERLDRDVSVALLLALERLTPLERAAFLLHDVFEQSYDELASALERTPESCRQLVSRARKHVQRSKPRTQVEPQQGEAIAKAFFMAAKSGDTDVLTKLLAQDVRFVSDGGGKVLATLNPILGRDKVMRLLSGLARKYSDQPVQQWQFCRLNNLPSILSHEASGLLQTMSLEIEYDVITAVYVVRNPEKTRHLSFDEHTPISGGLSD